MGEGIEIMYFETRIRHPLELDIHMPVIKTTLAK
jgi:hypothetical protein